MDTNGHECFSKDNPLIFEFGVLEVEKDADPETGDFQVIDHLGFFVVANGLNDFGVDDDGVEHDKVWHVFTHIHGFVNHWKSRLLFVGNASQLKLNYQRILIRLLQQSMSEGVQYLHGATDDLEDFFFT